MNTNELLQFALLGLGAGAAYALTGQCLVLVYRATGIINFAQSAMGMVAAYTFYELAGSRDLPVGAALALSTMASALLGVLIHFAVMRPLRHAAPLTRLMSTLAVLSVLLTVVGHLYDGKPKTIPKVMPNWNVRVVDGIAVPVDRLILLGVAVVVTLGLHVAFKRTKLGFATIAVSENERAVATLGISPGMVALANWTLAGFIGGLSAVLIGSVSRQVTANGIILLLVAALAAALFGGFKSFGLTLAGGLILGVVESEMARYVTIPGLAKSLPFIFIIVLMMLRGRSLPIRGESVAKNPAVGTGVIRPRPILAVAAAALVLTWVSSGWATAIGVTAVTAIIVMSVVVVVGYAGQLSLAQYALAGLGAWTASRLIDNYGLSFELAFIAALAVAVPVGVAVGLPAIRSRGANLAIATLGLALVIEQMILSNPARTGGVEGTRIGAFTLFGMDVDPLNHPERYATVVVGVLVAVGLMVANLRASRTGRRLVAIRSNERAAAAIGINVAAMKLYAFAVASALATTGGVLLAYRFPTVVFTGFNLLQSITVVLLSVIGGIGFIVGAVIGAATQPGAVFEYLTSLILRFDPNFLFSLIGGLGSLHVLITNPDGIAAMIRDKQAARAAKRAQRRTAAGEEGAVKEPPVELPAVPPTGTLRPDRADALVVSGLTVSFGGVRAVSSVDLRVEPGEIVGLIGPNGAGKTTIIDAVTGFSRPAQGRITLGDEDLARLSAARRARRGVVRSWQALELFEDLTVADNLRISAERTGVLSALIDLVRPRRSAPFPDAAIAAADALGVLSELQQTPSQLSYGHRRRVGIARAVASRPSVLLLDEPAAGLSRDETDALARTLRRLAHQEGVGILLVEHDISLVLDVADRMVVLDQGRVVADGDPTTVISRPDVAEAYLGIAVEDALADVDFEVELDGLAVHDEPEHSDEPMVTARRNRLLHSSEEIVLRVDGLTAGYGELEAVHGVDLTLRRGEIGALLGPNGAGKTTTLLAIAGAVRPTGGTVAMADVDLSGSLHRHAREGLALVTEERSVFMGLSVAANLRLGQGDPRRALELFPELEPHLHRQVGLLSGGQQQMLALGRALAARPRVLLADELSLGLAPLMVDRLLEAIDAAAADGMAVLLVEQFADRALEVADTAYVMNRGEIVRREAAANLRGQSQALWADYTGQAGRAGVSSQTNSGS